MTDEQIVDGLYRVIWQGTPEQRKHMQWNPWTQESHAWEAMDYLVAGDAAKAIRLASFIEEETLPGFFMLSTEARLRAITLGCAKLAGVTK